MVLNLVNSKEGRAIKAVRDNRIAAESVGINVTAFRLKAFVVSAVLAGMAGALYGLNFYSITASKFNFNTSINILVFVVLGGMGNIAGSVISATLLYLLPEMLRELEDLEAEQLCEELIDRAEALSAAREAEYGSELMREVERVMLLRAVDIHWMDHIDAMDELRRGIGLRAYANQDPVVIYRKESYDMFEAMVAGIREDTARFVLTVRLRSEQPVQL